MDLFNKKKIVDLENEIKALKELLTEYSLKLIEKQEHINKTNAYWKKRVHDLHKKSKL
jgi:hypothetical protein